MGSPQEKFETSNIPEHVLVAAARVMEREGFAGGSLRLIAAEAGLSKAGLYHHIPSKEVLLFALHERFSKKLVSDAETLLASANLSNSEKLQQLIKITVRNACVFKSEGTVFLREYAHLKGEMRDLIDRERDRFREIFETVIKRGIDAGEFRSGDARLDAFAVLGACNLTAYWYDPDGELSLDDIANSFAYRLFSGFGLGEAKAQEGRS